MRQDFFTYEPQFLLMVYGNNKPGLKSVDDAIRRRIKMAPFDVKISDADRDKELQEKLKAEWPGILAWMIEGCLMWQREGLVTPAAVEAATKDYLKAEDALGRWIEDCCKVDKNAQETHARLFGSWSMWSSRNNEYVGTSKRFTQMMLDRGFESQRIGGNAGFAGLKLGIDPLPKKEQKKPPPPPKEDPDNPF